MVLMKFISFRRLSDDSKATSRAMMAISSSLDGESSSNQPSFGPAELPTDFLAVVAGRVGPAWDVGDLKLNPQTIVSIIHRVSGIRTWDDCYGDGVMGVYAEPRKNLIMTTTTFVDRSFSCLQIE